MNDLTNVNTNAETRSAEEVLEDINATPEELMKVAEEDTDMETYTVTTTGPSLDNIFGANTRNVEISLAVVAVVSLIIALVVFFAITMKKKAPRGKFLKYIREFLNFRKVWIAGILKFIYLFMALALTIGSIVMMFFGGDHAVQMIIICLLTLIFGNILLRVGFEMTMITIGLWENTNDMRAVMVKDEEEPEPKEPELEEPEEVEEIEEEVEEETEVDE